MKILILAHKMPYPPRDGGSIVILNYAREFARLGCDVTILAMNTYKRRFDVEKVPEELKKMIKFHAVDVDTKIKVLYLFINLFQGVSYHIWRYGSSNSFRDLLVQILHNNKFDIIQIEGLYLAPYLRVIRENSNAKVVLRSHNVEYEVIERYAEWETSIFKKYWLRLQAKRLKKYEFGVLNGFDAIVAITERDANIFKENGCKIPIYVAQAGVEIENYKVNFENVDFNSLFFIGALDWFPNQQGLEWFLKDVWLEVHKRFPNLKFYIAGRNPHLWRFSAKVREFPNVELVGEVEDAREFMSSKGVMIAPVLSGGGIRVKIIEALAMGKIVITTTIGAEGIEHSEIENILIANTPNEFVNAIKIIRSKSGLNKYKNFSGKVVEKYDIKNLASQMLEFYKKI